MPILDSVKVIGEGCSKVHIESPAVWSEDDKAYIVDIAGVSAFGNTPEDALREFMVAMTLVVEAFGDKIKAAEATGAAGMQKKAACVADSVGNWLTAEVIRDLPTPDTAAHDADTRKEERAKVLEEAAVMWGAFRDGELIASAQSVQCLAAMLRPFNGLAAACANEPQPSAKSVLEESGYEVKRVRSLAQDKE